MFADPTASLRGRVTRDSLQRVLDHYARSGWSADLAVVTGDLIQDDTREAYELFSRMLESLALPVYCVPGNHDVAPLMEEALDREPFHYCGATQLRNWLVAGIDSRIDRSAAGRVSDRELERLDTLIADSPAAHVLVCMHHPPMPVGSKWLDEVGVQNGEEFLRRIAVSGKVRMAIFGHVHQAFEGEYASIAIIGTPSTCRQFAIGSDTYAVDDHPPAYRRINLHPDGAWDTELVWVPLQGRQAVKGSGA